ncbi:hypothetical protein [Pseudomonas sp. Irchel 3E20]|uniref:hypothetical protein n=1 Tax=Pseudomonas sp. Irchel 3E20 TaxID=2008983 RepID=UPI000BA41FCC|nr:hypothetical protein [Pseudomonas sp. Irchel 3E20]
MRWLFLLLVVLNVFYYFWHQQEAPLRAKDVMPLTLYRGSQQDIRLVSESAITGMSWGAGGAAPQAKSTCLFVGGFASSQEVQSLERRLAGLQIRSRRESAGLGGVMGVWLRIEPESRNLLDDPLLQNLAKEFNELKHKIMPCEGVATQE